ncbi:N-acyl-D-amino-acid deacylase [bacterium (candidate division B38) B3_B38]|nr:MAG: N-acyl-D-amino-acid deacylase [bacterium (candidate division B38) B3_B38]
MKGILRFFLAVAIIALLLLGLYLLFPPTLPYDLAIIGGMVVDGTGNPWFRADVGIKGERIAYIGVIPAKEASEVIRGKGLVVSPGFIDIHTHTDRGLLANPLAENYLYQGVTTVVGGNCGGSPYPIGEHLEKLRDEGISLNFATLVGHNTIRRKVMGMKDTPPTSEELAEMKRLVKQGITEGALGLSTGLKYVPGAYASTEEVIELAKVAARYHGIYATHMREEGLGVIEALKEAILIGEKGGLPVQISHHKVVSADLWGASKETLRLIEEAHSRGVEVTLDQYPYPATSTGLTVLFPPWSLVGGSDELKERLSHPETRQRIKEAIVYNIVHDRGGSDIGNITVTYFQADRSLEGKNLAEIARLRGWKPTPQNGAEIVMDIQLKGEGSAIYHCLNDEDIERIMRYRGGMVGSDGGITIFGRGVVHPRNYGTFPRVLGYYVREKGLLALEDAIRKMTSLPAQTLRLVDRGGLRVGAYADITIFDPQRVIDKATWENPHQYPEGIAYVIVNGKVVISRGKHTGELPGYVLRRRG